MNHPINFRAFILFLTLLTLGLFGASLYFQFVGHLEPCPLCMAQRVSIVVLFFSYFFSFFIKKPLSLYINTFFQLLFSIFGASMAGRQIWLIHMPSTQRPGCMPDMSVLWQYLPFSDFIHAFLNGTESCAESTWSLFGLNMPEWTLGFFLFFIIASIVLCFLSIHRQKTHVFR